MERFNYPNLAAMLAEGAEIIYLLECESYGRKLDEQEEIEEMKEKAELEAERIGADER
jgi:hypothetical protein